MHVLHQYILAISQVRSKRPVNPNQPTLEIAHQEKVDRSYEDDGLSVISSIEYFNFANGVQIKRVEEYEEGEATAEGCAEHWVSYEVISSPAGFDITPLFKGFTNQCQEAFGLKMHQQQAIWG